MDKVIHELTCRTDIARETMLGFPLDLSGELPIDPILPLLRRGRTLNNLGDPFVGGAYGLNTFEMEREVVASFCGLFQVPAAPDRWGYVTNSGSEGNLAGIAAGLARLPDAVVYASTKAHYSVDKACRLARAKLLKIEARADGSIDPETLDATMRSNMGRPAVVVLTAGTTMSGAVDDVPRCMLAAIAHGTGRYYVHVDAALSGLILPFLHKPPPFAFECGIDSISVSGHKMLGTPVPCGVYVTKHQPGRGALAVDYIGSYDSTIGGSRSGWASLAIWHALRTLDLEVRARVCVEMAAVAEQAILRAGWTCWRNPYCNTVVIRRPSDTIARKWQLAVDGELAHIITMPHVTGSMLEAFARDLQTVTE